MSLKIIENKVRELLRNEDCDCDDCHNHTVSTFGSSDGCMAAGTRCVIMYMFGENIEMVGRAEFETEAQALLKMRDVETNEKVCYICIVVNGKINTFPIRD